MTDKQDRLDWPRLEKRPYHPPRLYIYGDVNSLTRAKTPWTGTNDGKLIGPFNLKS